MRDCQGCFRWFAVAQFPYGTIYCAEDKKAIGNLYNAAKRQGQLDWYQKEISTKAGIKRLVNNYHDQCPEPKVGKSRKSFSISVYREVTRTQHAVILDDCGELMNRPTYIAHKGKAKYGGLNAEVAGKKWDDLERSADICDFEAETDDDKYRTNLLLKRLSFLLRLGILFAYLWQVHAGIKI